MGPIRRVMPWLVGQQGEVPPAFCHRPGSRAHGCNGPYLLASLSHKGQGRGYDSGMTYLRSFTMPSSKMGPFRKNLGPNIQQTVVF